jgi:3',5'-cyclic AMP phosphodiesterase CpdA
VQIPNEAFSALETVIRVSGLQQPLSIMHITDCHLTEVDERDEENVHTHADKQKAYFEERNFLTSGVNLERFTQRANQPDIDATVWTGDIIDFPSHANLDRISEQFGLLKKPYLYTLGNHDWLHAHQEINDQTRESNYGCFQTWVPEFPGYQVCSLGGVKLVALDNSNYQLEESQWKRLVVAMESDEPWLLFMHIPVGLPVLEQAVIRKFDAPILMAAEHWTAEARKHWHVKEDTPFTRLFAERIAARQTGQLLGIFCGHVHFSFEESFADNRLQYVTGPGFAGQYRLIRLLPEVQS